MSFTISKRFSFSASHALTAVPEGHKCRRTHGHNYEVEVVCAADELDERGMVIICIAAVAAIPLMLATKGGA